MKDFFITQGKIFHNTVISFFNNMREIAALQLFKDGTS